MAASCVGIAQQIEVEAQNSIECQMSGERPAAALIAANGAHPGDTTGVCNRAGDITMMMQVLIVENDPQVATALKAIVEINRLHSVTGIACDLDGAMASIEACPPQLVLIDLDLAGNATGIEVAARARERNVPTLFTTASPLPFPVPELALGCLRKPYSCYSVAQSLRIAETIIIGQPADGGDIPPELELY